MKRCGWVRGGSELDLAYHDHEWGVPVHDEHRWFEFLILEGAQAGLSWSTILRKRDHYRVVYDGFDPAVGGALQRTQATALLTDAGIVRNRLKVAASSPTRAASWKCSASSAASTPMSGDSSTGNRCNRGGQRCRNCPHARTSPTR